LLAILPAALHCDLVNHRHIDAVVDVSSNVGATDEAHDLVSEALFQALGDNAYELDRSFCFVTFNAGCTAYYGVSTAAALGRPIWDVLPGSAGSWLEPFLCEAMVTRRAARVEKAGVAHPDRWLEVTAFPTARGLGVAFRDRTGEHRAATALGESEARLRLALEAGRMAVWELDPATDTVIGSPELNRLFGFLTHVGPTPEERRARYLPGERERLRQLGREALARGERFFIGEFRCAWPDGSVHWLLLRAEMLLNADGRVSRVLGVLADVTDRKRAEVALQKSEAQLRDLVATLDLGAAMSRGRDGAIRFWSGGCTRLYGWTAEEAVGQDAHLLLRTEFPIPRAEIEAALERAGEWTGDLRQRTRDGREIVVAAQKVLRHGTQGEPEAVLETLVDVTAQRAAEAALRVETETLETLNSVGAAIAAELDLERLVQKVTDAGVALIGAAFGAFFYNIEGAGGEAYTLYTLSGASREAFSAFPMPRATAVFGPTLRGEDVLRSDDITADPRYGCNAPHRGMPEGHLPVRSYLAVPVVSRSGEALGGLFFGHPKPGVFTERAERLLVGIAAQAATAIDNARLYRLAQQEVEERRQTEAARQLLMREVDHRAKNALAVVHAAVRLTRAPDLPSYVRALEGRVSALVRAQTLLANDLWAGADLRGLLQGELAPFVGTRQSATFDGPRVMLPAGATQPLAMAMHELATNAVKHGALSACGGRVKISWRVEDGSEGQLRLRWAESGGPPVTAPSQRQGFGSRVLKATVSQQLGGRVSFAWEASGLICDIELPLAHRETTNGTAAL
jgi:PAS domain S-box-containing protein